MNQYMKLFVTLFLFISQWSFAESSVAAYEQKYLIFKEKIYSKYQEERARLCNKAYFKLLSLENDFQKQGMLKPVIAIKNLRSAVKESKTLLLESNLKSYAVAQAILVDLRALVKVKEDAAKGDHKKLNRSLLSSLEKKVSSLTKEGRIDEALLFNALKNKYQNELQPLIQKADPVIVKKAAIPKPVAPLKVEDPLEQLLGTYQVKEPLNGWHTGKITVEKRRTNGVIYYMRWTNNAGYTWTLKANSALKNLQTGRENPYYDKKEYKHGRLFKLQFGLDGKTVIGFIFLDKLFLKKE